MHAARPTALPSLWGTGLATRFKSLARKRKGRVLVQMGSLEALIWGDRVEVVSTQWSIPKTCVCLSVCVCACVCNVYIIWRGGKKNASKFKMRENQRRNREKNQFKRMLAQINSTRPKATLGCRKKSPSSGSGEEPSPGPEGRERRGFIRPKLLPVAAPANLPSRGFPRDAEPRGKEEEERGGSSVGPRRLADRRAGSAPSTARAGSLSGPPRARPSARLWFIV